MSCSVAMVILTARIHVHFVSPYPSCSAERWAIIRELSKL